MKLMPESDSVKNKVAQEYKTKKKAKEKWFRSFSINKVLAIINDGF